MAEVQIYRRFYRSSEKSRAAATEERDRVENRIRELTDAARPIEVWAEDLLEAAKRVLLNNGDPAAVESLSAAVVEAEKQRNIKVELLVLRKRAKVLDREATYYQWYAGKISGNLFLCVLAQADSRRELEKKLRLMEKERANA